MTTSFPIKPVLQIAAGASACLLALVVGLVIACCNRVSYPDCPFAKLPTGSVCIIPTTERPPKSKKAERDAWWAALAAAKEKMKEGATPAEAEALRSYIDLKYVRAREQAEAVLQQNPRSLAGMYVRAGVLLEARASPGEALRQIRIMRRALEAAGRKDPSDKLARDWYIRCVYLESQVLERLGEDRYSLRCIELIEQVFEPLPWEKTWPLMRLKEFDRAEESIAATAKTGRFSVQVLFDRMALESQRNQRAEAYRTSNELIGSLQKEDYEAVMLSNKSLADCSAFKFAEAETNLKTSLEYGFKQSRLTPHVSLAELYVQEGRLTDARNSLVAAKQERDRRDPSTWQFADGRRLSMLAKLLLVAGQSEQAEQLARGFVERPDRLGNSTMGPKDQAFLADLLLYAALHDRIEVLKEAAASQITDPQAGNRRALETELWLVGRRVQSELDGRRGDAAFQPHADEMPTTWHSPTLLQVLPAGVAQGLLERARIVDPLAAPYYDGYQAELDWRNRRYEAALAGIQQAHAQLDSTGELLLRTRLSAIAGDAAFRLGRYEDSRAHFSQVLNSQPSLLRSVGIRLPVHIQTDGSDTAKDIARQLTRSPRFVAHAQGFPVVIASANGQATCTLELATGPRKIDVAQSADVPARLTLDQLACQAFHKAVFSAQVEIDEATINQICGTTGAVRERDAISKLFANLNDTTKKK